MLKIGDKVKFDNGEGVIVDIDLNDMTYKVVGERLDSCEDGLVEKLRREYTENDFPQSDEFYESLARDIETIGDLFVVGLVEFLMDSYGEGTLGRDVDLFVDDILQAGLRLNEKFRKDYRH